MMDMRFMRLASVGLIVRAPSPVAIDIRLLVPGVAVRPGVAGCFPGVVWPTRDEVFCGSGVLEIVRRLFDDVLLTRTDLVFTPRGDFEPSLLPRAPLGTLVEPLLPALSFLALGRLLTSTSPVSGGRNVPGPTDFRGAFGGGLLLLNALGGKWLWRLPRIAPLGLGVAVAVGSNLDTYARLVVDAVEPVRDMLVVPAPDTFRVGAGMVVCMETFLWSICGTAGTTWAGPTPPGRCRLFKLESLVVMVSWKSSKLKVGSCKKENCVLSSSCRSSGTVFVGSMVAKLKALMSFIVGSKDCIELEKEVGTGS